MGWRAGLFTEGREGVAWRGGLQTEAWVNGWCETLRIDPPDLALVWRHRDANTFAKLIVVLLERGEPMTLDEVAHRFEEAGVTDAVRARKSLSRCKPGRAPVYRDGDHYALDPHDDEASLWVFRLGLRPPVPVLKVVRPAPPPIPEPDVPVRVAELREGFHEASLLAWSHQRLALAVLEAHGGAMRPADAVQFVDGLAEWHRFRVDGVTLRRGCPIVLADERWHLADGIDSHLLAMRAKVRELISKARKHRAALPDPEVMAARRKASDRRRAARQAELQALERAVVVAFPRAEPRAVALVDVRARTVQTFVDEELADLPARLSSFGLIGAMQVRPTLQALGFDWGDRRLADLSPPQKTTRLNRQGRTLKITTEMLISGSCGISQPFGDPERLRTYLAQGSEGRLRRRLEADARALSALYAYARLHGMVRLRWGYLDDMIPAPWSDLDEARLYALKESALERGADLEVVLGAAPGWAEPWARARRVAVMKEPSGWHSCLIDTDLKIVQERDVQAARVVE